MSAYIAFRGTTKHGNYSNEMFGQGFGTVHSTFDTSNKAGFILETIYQEFRHRLGMKGNYVRTQRPPKDLLAQRPRIHFTETCTDIPSNHSPNHYQPCNWQH